MLRRTLLAAALALGTMSTLALPAHAESSSAWREYDSYDQVLAHGSFTWYNRSVAVSGTITDPRTDPNGLYIYPCSYVRFDFYQSSVFLSTQRRGICPHNAASSHTRGFSWTEGAPRGGITEIRVCIGAQAYDGSDSDTVCDWYGRNEAVNSGQDLPALPDVDVTV